MNSEKQSTNLQMTLREVNRVGEGQKNVPKLRFKGYEDAWEQRKLGEEVQIVMGQSPKGENYTDNPEDYILVQGNADMKEGKVFPRVWTTQVTKKAYKGDIILSVRAPVGDIGKTDYDVVIGRGVAAVKGNEFFYQLLGKLKQDGYWTKSSTGSTFDSINSNEIKDAKVTIPDANEQLFIGNYFKEMDNLITLHQRKYDALKLMKKTLLSRMFPKNGEDVPEIRFKGFTDAWEQRKLGSEFKKVNERNDGTFGKGHWISVAKMYFQDPEKVQSNNIDTRTYVMRLGDIAFEGHPNNEFQFGRFVANDIGDGVVSELFPVYRHNNQYYNNYWKYAIQQERIMAPIFAKSITSSGNSSNKLDPKHFLRQKIRIATLEEQKNIGDFLAEIDNLITLHQRKLDELKNMKKTLLQQMFV